MLWQGSGRPRPLLGRRGGSLRFIKSGRGSRRLCNYPPQSADGSFMAAYVAKCMLQLNAIEDIKASYPLTACC